MKLTLSWLKRHLQTDAPLDTIARQLTMMGLEVENIDFSDPLAHTLKNIEIAKIIETSPHPNAERLQYCKVETQKGVLSIVCGAPNARPGLKVALAPIGTYLPAVQLRIEKVKIRGLESHGMLCSESELGVPSEADGIIELDPGAPIGENLAHYWARDDQWLHLAITPNRGDCLGVRGIARDLAAAGLGALRPLHGPVISETLNNPFKIVSELPEFSQACPMFAIRMIQGVKNKASFDCNDGRNSEQLLSIGQKSISGLVDIANWVMFDQNRPLHIFDASKISGKNIVLRYARDGETLVGIDDQEYRLTSTDIVISDDSGVISLAGIMGGKSTSVDMDTTDILLESALFDPIHIASTGRRLGILSEARHRFERWVDPESVVVGLDTATSMILDQNGGKASDVFVVGKSPYQHRTISIEPGDVQKRTGVHIPESTQAQVLSHLGFVKNDSGFVAPSWRNDIHDHIDLIEEILRMVGYDHIPSTPMPNEKSFQATAVTVAQLRLQQIRLMLAARGMNEWITWSFADRKDLNYFSDISDAILDDLTLANPINHFLNTMRSSLLVHLIKGTAQNTDLGADRICAFEIGPIYEGPNPDQQKTVVAGIRYGHAVPRHWTDRARRFDLFDVKADALSIISVYQGISNNLQLHEEGPSWYHPGRSGRFCIGKKDVGYFGELHPLIQKHFGFKKPVCMFEILTDALIQPKPQTSLRSALNRPTLQKIKRDFAFWIPMKQRVDALQKTLMKCHPMIEQVDVFDIFVDHERSDQKSVALAITIQPHEIPLDDQALQLISDRVVHEVTTKFHGQLRNQ